MTVVSTRAASLRLDVLAASQRGLHFLSRHVGAPETRNKFQPRTKPSKVSARSTINSVRPPYFNSIASSSAYPQGDSARSTTSECRYFISMTRHWTSRSCTRGAMNPVQITCKISPCTLNGKQ